MCWTATTCATASTPISASRREDRAENIRRVGEVAASFADAGMIAITAFISPYRADRQRRAARAGDIFHEIYVQADVATCEKRDPKGLYKKARSGEIAEFTGVSAPYEEPEAPNSSSTPCMRASTEAFGPSSITSNANS